MHSQLDVQIMLCYSPANEDSEFCEFLLYLTKTEDVVPFKSKGMVSPFKAQANRIEDKYCHCYLFLDQQTNLKLFRLSIF